MNFIKIPKTIIQNRIKEYKNLMDYDKDKL